MREPHHNTLRLGMLRSLREPGGWLAEPRINTPTSLAGPRMSAVTVLLRVLILTTPDRGDAPAYHRSQWTTSSKGRRSGRTRGRSRRSAG
jgi:hypothetical protein